MESQNDKLATTLLTQVYNDYQKEKRYKRYTRYAFILIIFYFMYASFSSFKDMSNSAKQNKALPSQNFVPVIEIFGVIGGEEVNYTKINGLLEEAFSIESAPGVILHIDSPGGAPYDCYEITRKMADLKKKYPEKKIIAQVASLAASGGYYIASAADKIYASEASTLGSIGVIMQYMQVNRFLERYDVIPQVHQAGEDKATIHPYKDLTPEGKKALDALLKEHHDIFIDTVKSGRGDRLKTNSGEKIFTGKVWMGRKSLELGLIDNIGLFNEMFASEFGEELEAYVIEEEFDLDFRKLLAKPHIKIEGLDLNAKTLFQWY